MSNDPSTNLPNPTPSPATGISEKKLVSALLAIFLGGLGIHKFYLGYKKEAIIMLCISVLSCFILAIIPSVIGLIEGIIYLMKSNEEFDRIYVHNQKPWF